ncbi:ketopantoate reductase family protein [Heliorestis convoluta]|uniref:2-dehydropantoate 2-reductase n=1 Tax=Heliorestis convoluta TaxID=356322 RepID=A0A5Q2N5K3_9FIRM|nr:2-dehydropantoate 2-reductase [Heliorestis convoluta]QGG47520.1 2-dehydropantoate 2-reductase [Heliorestis convoluta]
MKIAVLGAGAMGSLYGSFLSQSGADLWLIDIWKEHIEEIQKKGITIEEGEASYSIPVKATIDKSQVGPVDLLLIFVKSYQTKKALEDLSPLIGEETTFLTLQNGLGNDEAIVERYGQNAILAGTSSFGATLLGPGRIRVAGRGETTLGILRGATTESLEKVAQLFRQSQLNPRIEENVQGPIWDKLLVNVGINALTALMQIPNGRLLDHKGLLYLLEQAVREAEEVAKALQVPTSPQPVEKTKKIAQVTGHNFSSMYQDLHNGRRTEIDAINGKVAACAKSVGLPTPVNETLGLLIEAMTEVKQIKRNRSDT